MNENKYINKNERLILVKEVRARSTFYLAKFLKSFKGIKKEIEELKKCKSFSALNKIRGKRQELNFLNKEINAIKELGCMSHRHAEHIA